MKVLLSYSCEIEEKIMIRKAMKTKKMTYKKLSELTGLSLPYIQSFVVGRRYLKPYQISQLENILDIKII